MKSLTNNTYCIGGKNADNLKVLIEGPELHPDSIPEGHLKISTAELCKQAINAVPNGGLTPDEMFKRLQVLGVLETQKKEACITFEDEQFNKLKECVSKMQFVIIEAAFNHFVNEVNAVK